MLLRVLVLVMLASALAPGTLHAQEPPAAPAAEVRTWDGRVWLLEDVRFRARYTLAPPVPPVPVPGTPVGGVMLGPSVAGRAAAPRPPQPEPIGGARVRSTLTVVQAGVAVDVPVERLAALVLTRQPVAAGLPPWTAGMQYRYAASVTLADGTQVSADYVNLGTTVLTGRSAAGAVEIPWTDVERAEFRR